MSSGKKNCLAGTAHTVDWIRHSLISIYHSIVILALSNNSNAEFAAKHILAFSVLFLRSLQLI